MKVSVLVSVYNGEFFIERCLNSILNQSYSDYEIIIMDDGSSDETVKIVNSFCEKYSNIHLISRSNKGVSYSRNELIKRASGDFITFIDSDDVINEDYILGASEYFMTSDFIVCRMEKKSNIEKIFLDNVKNIKKYILLGNFYACGWFLNRKFLEEHKIDFLPNYIIEDFSFITQILISKPRFAFSKNSTYFYIENKHSQTSGSNYDFIAESTKQNLIFLKEKILIKKDLTNQKIYKMLKFIFNKYMYIYKDNIFLANANSDKNFLNNLKSFDKLFFRADKNFIYLVLRKNTFLFKLSKKIIRLIRR